jgi:hypothetical protein
LKKNVEASSRYDPSISWRDWGKIRKPSEKIAGVEGEIGKEHLPNMKLEVYSYTNPFGSLHSEFICVAFRINLTPPRIIVITFRSCYQQYWCRKGREKRVVQEEC